MCHVSCVLCQVSRVMCHIKKNLFFLSLKKVDKVVELVGGGSVINGAYPVYIKYIQYFVEERDPFLYKFLII